eukprot:GHVS01090625.1.p3 GENE.GHVS01090625.1~~GHVS01090625.1.p3  ORF type:complete len:109 (-),score=12.57 GHVS01090625.1:60-386(-)
MEVDREEKERQESLVSRRETREPRKRGREEFNDATGEQQGEMIVSEVPAISVVSIPVSIPPLEIKKLPYRASISSGMTAASISTHRTDQDKRRIYEGFTERGSVESQM